MHKQTYPSLDFVKNIDSSCWKRPRKLVPHVSQLCQAQISLLWWGLEPSLCMSKSFFFYFWFSPECNLLNLLNQLTRHFEAACAFTMSFDVLSWLVAWESHHLSQLCHVSIAMLAASLSRYCGTRSARFATRLRFDSFLNISSLTLTHQTGDLIPLTCLSVSISKTVFATMEQDDCNITASLWLFQPCEVHGVDGLECQTFDWKRRLSCRSGPGQD